ncbi:MAG: dihydrofolate reductase [Clostridia bacterium]|nr:dihydrofolate reductase [Clostridia bacterium]
MNLIVAVSKNWGIGKQNTLLFNLPSDLKYFKQKTYGKVVCMGYNTLLSLPKSSPLKNRVNIVIAPSFVERDDCIIVHDLEGLKSALLAYNTDDVFVIGGGMFYKTMLPYCSKAYITEVDSAPDAEIYFENLDKLNNWHRQVLSEDLTENGLTFRFTLYTNDSPLCF